MVPLMRRDHNTHMLLQLSHKQIISRVSEKWLTGKEKVHSVLQQGSPSPSSGNSQLFLTCGTDILFWTEWAIALTPTTIHRHAYT